MTSETMIKSAGTVEQKGVAQLLQIEGVWLGTDKSRSRSTVAILPACISNVKFYLILLVTNL